MLKYVQSLINTACMVDVIFFPPCAQRGAARRGDDVGQVNRLYCMANC